MIKMAAAAARGFFYIVVVSSCCLAILNSNSSPSAVVSCLSDEKVELALYYETLCPYCSNFMVNYLPSVFHNQLIDIIHLNLVPYGNARLGSDNTITCQKKHYTFIYCVERLVFEGKYIEWESCFGKTGFDSKPIEDCYKSGLGKQLELEYANETKNIQPPHRYVPWVTVNGQPLYEDYQNFATYVCKAYKGSRVPKACRDQVAPETVVSKEANDNNRIKQVYCDAAKETTSLSPPETKSRNIRSPVTSWRRKMMKRVT